MDNKNLITMGGVVEELKNKNFEEWYMNNRLPDDLKEKVIPSYNKFCKEQKPLMIFNILFSIMCVVLFYILMGKNSEFGTIFVFYLVVWLFAFIFIFLITIGIHNIVRRNTSYPIYSRWIRKNVIWTVISLPDNEAREQELLNELRKKIMKEVSYEKRKK